jgi:hypothetical protein
MHMNTSSTYYTRKNLIHRATYSQQLQHPLRADGGAYVKYCVTRRVTASSFGTMYFVSFRLPE